MLGYDRLRKSTHTLTPRLENGINAPKINNAHPPANRAARLRGSAGACGAASCLAGGAGAAGAAAGAEAAIGFLWAGLGAAAGLDVVLAAAGFALGALCGAGLA